MKKIVKLIFATFGVVCFSSIIMQNINVHAEENNYESKFYEKDGVEQFFLAEKYKNNKDLNYCEEYLKNASLEEPKWNYTDEKDKLKKVTCNGQEFDIKAKKQFVYVYHVGYIEKYEIYRTATIKHVKYFDESTITFTNTDVSSQEFSFAIGAVVNFELNFGVSIEVEASALGTRGNSFENENTLSIDYPISLDASTGYYNASIYKNLDYYKQVIINEYKVSRSDKNGAQEGYVFEFERNPAEKVIGYESNSMIILNRFDTLDEIYD